jgi:cytochrome c-type biogenesis protein CcmH/NrfG
VLFELASIAAAEKDYAQAEPLLDRVLRKQPDHVEAHFLLSDVYRRTGRPESAKKERETFERLRQKEQERQSAKDSGKPPANGPSVSTANAPKEQ